MARDDSYARLVGLAMALAERRRCPVCEAKEWKTIPKPTLVHIEDEQTPIHAVPMVCGECGYLMQFLCSYLESRANALGASRN